MLLKQRRLSIPKFGSVFGSNSNSKPDSDFALIASENSWVGSLSLKRIVRPDLEHERHRDTSLQITIHESKNLPPQKRYFCDVCLDRKLYARTSSKLSKETVFWGECFDLNNLVELNFITINLYREADYTKDASKRRKSSKAQNQLVAFLTIAISELSTKYETQQWHIMTPASMLPSSENLYSNAVSPRSHQSVSSFNSCESTHNSPDAYAGGSTAKRSVSLVGPPPTNLLAGRIRKLSKQNIGGSETRMNVNPNGGSAGGSGTNISLPQIRLAVKYQSVDVLPIHCYDSLRKLVMEKSTEFVQFLEPILPTKKKEELARCLVNAHEKAPESNIAKFLAPLVDKELDSNDNLSLLFRSNSICSKSVECYIKLVGAEYLQKLLRNFIENLLVSNVDLEVDPSRLAGGLMPVASDSGNTSNVKEGDLAPLRKNQNALMDSVKIVFQRLQSSLDYFPADLRETLASIRRTVELRHGQEVGDQLVSGCLFLRYICPAIHGPTLFGLTNAVPDDPRVSRNLTLLAKVLQTIANFSHFEAKENYMRFMNTFVQSRQEEMHQFLRAVSTTETEDTSGIWIKQKANVSTVHNSIDLGYELTMLHHHLAVVLDEHPKVPDSLAELPDILGDISRMLASPSLRRCNVGISTARRCATSTCLEDTALTSAATHRFHSTVTPPSQNGLYRTPNEQPATPSSTQEEESASQGAKQRANSELSSPFAENLTQRQTFFGENFEGYTDSTRGKDLESISETEASNSSPVGQLRLSSSSNKIECNSYFLNSGQTRPAGTQRFGAPRNSASLQRPRGNERSVTIEVSCGPHTNTLPSQLSQKWTSGPELREDSPVILNFPPPPPSATIKHDGGGGLGGSSTNIRMGTRALRMSRERDLSGRVDSNPPVRNGESTKESIQLSTVPVILQCEASITSGKPRAGKLSGTAESAVRGDGSRSVDSVTGYDSSASSSSCLSMMPQADSARNVNGGGQGVFVAENSHYFELPGDITASAMSRRSYRIPNVSANAGANCNDPALLSRVHNLLFGGGNGSEYQNFGSLTRSMNSSNPHEDKISGLSKSSFQQPVNEVCQLEALQQKLRTMEEHLNQERCDMQKAVASNMRMMESQERCINELIEEINRLQSLRSSNTAGSPKANAPVPPIPTNQSLLRSDSPYLGRGNQIGASLPTSPTPKLSEQQKQPSVNSWW